MPALLLLLVLLLLPPPPKPKNDFFELEAGRRFALLLLLLTGVDDRPLDFLISVRLTSLFVKIVPTGKSFWKTYPFIIGETVMRKLSAQSVESQRADTMSLSP